MRKGRLLHLLPFQRRVLEYERKQIKQKPNTYIQVSHHVDNLTRGVGIVDEPLVGHVSQLSKCQHQFPQHILWDTRPILPQHGQLRFDVWVVNGMTAEDVTCVFMDMLKSNSGPLS